MRNFQHITITIIFAVAAFIATTPIAFAADIKPVTLDLQMPIPGMQGRTIELCHAGADNELNCDGIATYIARLYTWLIVAGSILAVLYIMIGGLQYLTAGGSGRGQQGQKMMTDALAGLALLLGSYVILYTINPAFVQKQTLELSLIGHQDAVLETIQSKGEENSGGTTSIDTSSLPSGGDGNLDKLDTFVSSKEHWGLGNNSCLGWVYRSLIAIYGQRKAYDALPAGNVPAVTAAGFNSKGNFSPGLDGIKNGDVVFMSSPGSSLITRGLAGALPGYTITHIGIYYNRKIYHQYGIADNIKASPISKNITAPATGVLSDIPNEQVVGYGKTHLTP